ncbi:DUF3857 domain-containing protein [Fulvivirga sp. M361]|uniref:DUF3857 domain-containing protein n=1 Tax=Fulvivirga sp. M361 TaxID=2594266 RepID=UPI00117AD6B3|nr:DUF3857 domain-containing protein [Fulvivirga sp. M361]TRX48714.1 DUF3857 domain-containing protein [Fulvivirga sp. M361]
MKSSLLILLFLVPYLLFSQEFPREFGRISPGEIEMESYEKDPKAGAVVLFDIGESVFFDMQGGYDIRFTRTRRIKIFDQTALDNAEVSIPYYVDGYGQTEIVRSIEAYTYNFEGGRLMKKTLDPSTIFEERINNRWLAKKFVFPDVKEGSIIEFKYVLETPFHFNLPDWTFQDKIPTLYSQYKVGMIPFYEYTFLAQGIKRFDYQTSELAKTKRTWGSVVKNYGQNIGSGIEFQDYVHTYALKNVPAFTDESYITSKNDYIIKIDFQLAKFHRPDGSSSEIISTWPKLNEAFLKDDKFGKYIKSCGRLAKKIFDTAIVLTGKSEKEKNEMIINYVKSNFSWNGHYARYVSKSAKEFFAQKTGNSADINLFLTALLKHAGMDAHPVLLSTRSHGKIRVDYPFEHFFNYVIVFVNGERPFLTDGTTSYLSYDRIPPRCINDKGLLVKNDEVNWIMLNNNIPSLEKKHIAIELNPDQLTANTNISIQTTEYEAYKHKSNHQNDTISLKEFFSKKIGTIKNIKTSNYNNPKRPYTINLQGETGIEKIGNNIILSPFLNLGISKNQLIQKKRTYPVDFVYSTVEEFNIYVKVPDGFKITELPTPYNMNNDLAEIRLDYQMNQNTISITGKYVFKKSIYSPEEYPKVKTYLDTIVKRFNAELVFEKI